MPLYIYKAVDRKGQVIRNRVEELNRHVLLGKLKKNGYMPIKVTQIRMSKKANNIRKKQKKNIESSGSILKTVREHQANMNTMSRAEMIKKDKNIVCLLVGDGELVDTIQKQCEEYGISQYVRFLGVRSDIQELLMCLDLFIMPSLYEGLPVSMIEVQASGVPALISDAISSEVKINSNVEFCSLNDNANIWADVGFTMISKGRVDEISNIVNAGYDINATVMKYKEVIEYVNVDDKVNDFKMC